MAGNDGIFSEIFASKNMNIGSAQAAGSYFYQNIIKPNVLGSQRQIPGNMTTKSIKMNAVIKNGMTPRMTTVGDTLAILAVK